jgi:hypothetical protein
VTSRAEFKLETRRYGEGHILCAQIVCGYCNYEAWFPAKNGGWATRVCRSHGWKVGNKANQHRCPKCFGRAMASRRTPDNPAIPKEIGKVIKTKLMEAHVKDALLGSSAITRHPEKPAQDPLYLSDLIVPIEPEKATAPAPEPDTGILLPIKGKRSAPGVTKFTTPENARFSAAAAAKGVKGEGGVHGVDYFVVPLEDGWTWKWAADTSDDERAAWRARRKIGPRAKTIEERRALADFKSDTPWPRPTTTPAEEETPMTNVTPITRKDPMPLDIANEIVANVTPAPAVDPARLPTRDERAMIHDALTTAYDNVDQRYLKDGSDKSLGEKLNVPRAWVTEVRTLFFGDHDRNAESEKHKQHLEASIVIARAATSRLMELAAEAEGIQLKLEAQLKKLVG